MKIINQYLSVKNKAIYLLALYTPRMLGHLSYYKCKEVTSRKTSPVKYKSASALALCHPVIANARTKLDQVETNNKCKLLIIMN